VSSQDLKQISNNSRVSLDWGLSFARSHKKLLLSFALIPAIIEIFIAYTYFSSPLSQQGMFLTFVLSTGVNAWFLAVIVMSCFSFARGNELSFKKISLKALQGLPKVFFSYVSLISLVVLCAVIRPLILVIILFIWAPIFCVAEQSLFEDEDNDKKETKEPEDIYTAKRVVVTEDESSSLLKNKSIFELGFARSVQLSTKNLFTTIQVGLLLWCANIVPSALLQLVVPSSVGFFSDALKIAVSAWVDVFSVSAAAGAFLYILTPQAKTELGIGDVSEIDPENVNSKRFRFHENMKASICLAVIALGSTALFVYQLRNARSVPTDLISELRSASVKENVVELELTLNDTSQRFRWFEPSNLRIAFVEKQGVGIPLGYSDAQDSGQPAVAVPEDSLVVPKNFFVKKSDGTILPQSNFTPIDGPLEMRLLFKVPEKGIKAGLGEKGQFVLYYSTFFREPVRITQGRYGLW